MDLEAHSQLWLCVCGESAAQTRVIQDIDTIFQKVFVDVKPATAIVRGVDGYVVQGGKRQRATYNLPAPCTAEKVFRSPAGSAADPTEFSPHEFLPLLGYGGQTNLRTFVDAGLAVESLVSQCSFQCWRADVSLCNAACLRILIDVIAC
eukprot:s529_g16.t1